MTFFILPVIYILVLVAALEERFSAGRKKYRINKSIWTKTPSRPREIFRPFCRTFLSYFLFPCSIVFLKRASSKFLPLNCSNCLLPAYPPYPFRALRALREGRPRTDQPNPSHPARHTRKIIIRTFYRNPPELKGGIFHSQPRWCTSGNISYRT